ncbi:hypothetical protein Tco_0500135 [Tanacetum coccineum]
MLSSFLISQDFSKGSVDPTMFIHREGNELLLVQIYVDDIIFVASTPEALLFLKSEAFFLNQSKYAFESLKKYSFDSCDPVDTPMVEKSKLDEDREGKASVPVIRLRPIDKHLHAVKRIFRYLRGTVNRGLWYPKDSSIAICILPDEDHVGCQDYSPSKHRVERVENGVIELYFVNTEYQLADIFTKPLCRERIEFVINKLGMRSFTPETLKELADEAEE